MRMIRYIISVLVFLFCSNYSLAQNEVVIQGKVMDADQEEYLPFVNIAIKGTNNGTISNAKGSFLWEIPSDYSINDSVVFSCIGYHNVILPINSLLKGASVYLKTSIIELTEVIVTPLTAKEHVRRAIQEIPSNYADHSFETKGYFNQLLAENGSFLEFSEAIVHTFSPSYLDTTKNQVELLHTRKLKDVAEIQFMKKELEKEARKEKRKTERKNNKEDSGAIEADTSQNDLLVLEGILGPSLSLESDPVRNIDNFNEEWFEKSQFSIEGFSIFNSKKVIIISFEQKKKIDDMKSNGLFFIDYESDAIIAYEYNGRVILPTIIYPLLFAIGIGIGQPKIHQRTKYKQIGNKWYLSDNQLDAEFDITRKHLFSKNETSAFYLEQYYIVEEYQLENTKEIPIENQYDSKSFPEGGNEDPFWNDFKSVKPKYILEELETDND